MKKPLFYTLLFSLFVTICYSQKINVNENNKIATALKRIDYSGLFLYGERSLCDSIWQNGINEKSFISIVNNPTYKTHTRFLASEVLYDKAKKFPTTISLDTLAKIYSYALEISGAKDKPFLVGNRWGFMYYDHDRGYKDYGDVGKHLMNARSKAIPYLKKLLENNGKLFYEGSEEATIGNSLHYRVKDAAAFFIGQILNIPVTYYDKNTDRDVEIEKLKKALTKY